MDHFTSLISFHRGAFGASNLTMISISEKKTPVCHFVDVPNADPELSFLIFEMLTLEMLTPGQVQSKWQIASAGRCLGPLEKTVSYWPSL